MTFRSRITFRLAAAAATCGAVFVGIGRARAQYFPPAAQYSPAMGYGGWGTSNAWNAATGGMGMSPYGPVNPAAQAAQAQARYQVQTAQAARAYQQAQLLQQQATAAAIERQRQSQPLQDRYSARTGTPTGGNAAPKTPAAGLEIDKLVDRTGKPRWPAGIATDIELATARAAADEAIAAAFREYQSKGSASVASVADAKQKLADYGNPALRRTRARNRARAEGLLSYLETLDSALNTMGGVGG
jgi:hypothetical protein